MVMKKFLHKHTKGMLVLFLALTGTMTAKADITFFVHTTQNWSEVKMHTWSGYDSWNDNASLFTAVPGATNTWVYTVTTNSNISFNGYAYTGALSANGPRGVDVNIGDRTYTNGRTYHIFHYRCYENGTEKWRESVYEGSLEAGTGTQSKNI